MSVIQLPEWIECEAKVNRGEANALEKFIHHNEPAGKESEAWRESLADVILECEVRS